jgi:hypothetical protein
MAQKLAGLKSIGSQQITMEALLRDPLARAAFEKLTQKDEIDREKLWSLLRTIPYASNKVVKLVDGMEDRTVRKLPDRICGWADAIEELNSSPWLSPNLLPKRASFVRHPEGWPKPLNRILTPALALPTANQLLNIPSMLRFYADFLRAWLEMFHPVGKRRRDLGLGNGIRLQKYLILKLLGLVRSSSGSPRYKEIANLLDAVYRMTDKSRPKTTYEQNLAKLEKNNEWLVWILRDSLDRD